MKIIFRLKRHYYLVRVSILLIMVALIAGMVGCAQPAQYDLTISSTEGGVVTDPGEGTFSYDTGTAIDLVAEYEEGYHFVNWTGDVDTIVNINAATTTITINGDYSITANFVTAYALNISSTEGGRVMTPGEAGPYTYGEGTRVNLVAQAEVGYHFVNWTGDVNTITNVNAAVTTIIMSSNYTITANFAADLYFRTDAYVWLNGPATLPPEKRNPCVLLQIFTNIVMDKVRVDMPDGRLIIVPRFTDVFSPGVDQITSLRFLTCEPGMPIAGGEYIFTGLNVTGEPIPGVGGTDTWVGVELPDPPTNVRAEVTEDGISISWDESPIVPGSFEPTAYSQLGYYQLEISRVEKGGLVYGASCISMSPHLIPQDKADFIEGKDWGLSLSEMEDGTYCLRTCIHSIAPKGSLGKGFEYNTADSNQAIIFTIQNGEITIG
jgi:hypothetical protein